MKWWHFQKCQTDRVASFSYRVARFYGFHITWGSNWHSTVTGKVSFGHFFFTKGKCFSHTPVVFLCSWPTTGAMDSMPTAGSTKRFMGWGVPKSTNWKMQSRWVKNYSFPMVLVARTWFTMMWQWITINEDKKKYCRELQENGGSTADLRNSDTPRSQGQLD